MARDHTDWLRAAVVTQLLADPGVSAIVGTRVYGERVVSGLRPLVHVPPMSPGPWEASCLNGMEVTLRVDAYAEGEDGTALFLLNRAVVDALDGAQLASDGVHTNRIDWTGTQNLIRAAAAIGGFPGRGGNEDKSHRSFINFIVQTSDDY